MKNGPTIHQTLFATLRGTIIPIQDMFEDDFSFPKVGYVSSLEGNSSHFALLISTKLNSLTYAPQKGKNTLPETNGSPLKIGQIGRAPKRKRESLPTIHFQGQTCC